MEGIEEDKNGEDGQRGEVRREEKGKGTKQRLSYHFKEEEEVVVLQDDGEKSSKTRGEKRKEDPK